MKLPYGPRKPIDLAKFKLTTNSTFDIPPRIARPVERVLCHDHMSKTVEYDGAEQCVECGSCRMVERASY